MKLPHVYVHVPFCARRCSYCDFAVTAVRHAPTGTWLNAIGAELRLWEETGGWVERPELRTLYLGGGTPSMLGEGVAAALVETLAGWVDPGTLVEFTAEANPESFGRELARDWRAAGIDRLSLGLQTFHEPALRWMGRLHGPERPMRAVAEAREAGFDNISLDLIFGLPARLGRDWEADIDRVLALEPEHISLYGLTAEAATPLGRWVREGREALAEDDTYEAEYLLAAERLSAAGYEHYEVSNFARPGRRSRHNAAYWSGAPYLGLGPGAHSYQPPRRFWNVRDWMEYARLTASGRSACEGQEEVTGAAATLERTWLALRTSGGHDGLRGRQIAVARSWEDRGLARVEGDGVRLTPRGWLLLDRLATELDEAA